MRRSMNGIRIWRDMGDNVMLKFALLFVICVTLNLYRYSSWPIITVTCWTALVTVWSLHTTDWSINVFPIVKAILSLYDNRPWTVGTVWFVVLRPSRPIKVMSSMVSWPIHTVAGQASKQLTTVLSAATWQNQQNECAPSEDSDQPGHPPSLISLGCVLNG